MSPSHNSGSQRLQLKTSRWGAGKPRERPSGVRSRPFVFFMFPRGYSSGERQTEKIQAAGLSVFLFLFLFFKLYVHCKNGRKE